MKQACLCELLYNFLKLPFFGGGFGKISHQYTYSDKKQNNNFTTIELPDNDNDESWRKRKSKEPFDTGRCMIRARHQKSKFPTLSCVAHVPKSFWFFYFLFAFTLTSLKLLQSIYKTNSKIKSIAVSFLYTSYLILSFNS